MKRFFQLVRTMFIIGVFIGIFLLLCYISFTSLSKLQLGIFKSGFPSETESTALVPKAVKPIFVKKKNSKYLQQQTMGFKTMEFAYPQILSFNSGEQSISLTNFYIPNDSSIIIEESQINTKTVILLPTNYGSGFSYHIINKSSSPVILSIRINAEETTATPCPTSSEQETESFSTIQGNIMEIDQYFSGSPSIINNIPNSNVSDCYTSCALNSQCNAFFMGDDYNEQTGTGTCTLTSAFSNPFMTTSDSGKTGMFKYPTMVPPSNNCGTLDNIYINADGELIDTIYNVDETTCSEKCINNLDCEMYLMGEQNSQNTCQLYTNVSNVKSFCEKGSCPYEHEKYGKLKAQSIVQPEMVPPINQDETKTMILNGSLEPNTKFYSTNKQYYFELSSTGNLQIFEVNSNGQASPVWSTNTEVSNPTLAFLLDGTLAIVPNYDPNNYVNYNNLQWYSMTGGTQANTVLLTNSGKLVIIDIDTKIIYFESDNNSETFPYGNYNVYNGIGVLPESEIPKKTFINTENFTPYKISTIDYNSCMNQCSNDSNCKMAISTDSAINNCMNYNDVSSASEQTSTIKTYGKVKSSATKQSVMVPNLNNTPMNATGTPIQQIYNTDESTCESLCAANPSCDMYLMNVGESFDENSCVLYSDVSSVSEGPSTGKIKARSTIVESFESTPPSSTVPPSNMSNVSYGMIVSPISSVSIPAFTNVNVLSINEGFCITYSSNALDTSNQSVFGQIINPYYDVINSTFQSPLNIVLNSGNEPTRFNFENIFLPSNSTIYANESLLTNNFINVLNLPIIKSNGILYICNQNSKNPLNVVYTNGFVYGNKSYNSFLMKKNSYVILSYANGTIYIVYQIKVDFESQITDSVECTNLGGDNFNYCPDTGIYYCCGVCTAENTKCDSNASLENCACLPFQNYITVSSPLDSTPFTTDDYKTPTINTMTADPPAFYDYSNVSFPTQSTFILSKDSSRYPLAGVLHYFDDCTLCSLGNIRNFNFCENAVDKLAKYSEYYTIGLPVSKWGCENINSSTQMVRFPDLTMLTEPSPNGILITNGIYAVEPTEGINSENNIVTLILPSFDVVNNGTIYKIINDNSIVHLIVKCPFYANFDTFEGLTNSNQIYLPPNFVCKVIMLNQTWSLLTYVDELGNSLDEIPSYVPSPIEYTDETPAPSLVFESPCSAITREPYDPSTNVQTVKCNTSEYVSGFTRLEYDTGNPLDSQIELNCNCSVPLENSTMSFSANTTNYYGTGPNVSQKPINGNCFPTFTEKNGEMVSNVATVGKDGYALTEISFQMNNDSNSVQDETISAVSQKVQGIPYNCEWTGWQQQSQSVEGDVNNVTLLQCPPYTYASQLQITNAADDTSFSGQQFARLRCCKTEETPSQTIPSNASLYETVDPSIDCQTYCQNKNGQYDPPTNSTCVAGVVNNETVSAEYCSQQNNNLTGCYCIPYSNCTEKTLMPSYPGGTYVNSCDLLSVDYTTTGDEYGSPYGVSSSTTNTPSYSFTATCENLSDIPVQSSLENTCPFTSLESVNGFLQSTETNTNCTSSGVNPPEPPCSEENDVTYNINMTPPQQLSSAPSTQHYVTAIRRVSNPSSNDPFSSELDVKYGCTLPLETDTTKTYTETTSSDKGLKIAPGTIDNLSNGPCFNTDLATQVGEKGYALQSIQFSASDNSNTTNSESITATGSKASNTVSTCNYTEWIKQSGSNPDFVQCPPNSYASMLEIAQADGNTQTNEEYFRLLCCQNTTNTNNTTEQNTLQNGVICPYVLPNALPIGTTTNNYQSSCDIDSITYTTGLNNEYNLSGYCKDNDGNYSYSSITLPETIPNNQIVNNNGKLELSTAKTFSNKPSGNYGLSCSGVTYEYTTNDKYKLSGNCLTRNQQPNNTTLTSDEPLFNVQNINGVLKETSIGVGEGVPNVVTNVPEGGQIIHIDQPCYQPIDNNNQNYVLKNGLQSDPSNSEKLGYYNSSDTSRNSITSSLEVFNVNNGSMVNVYGSTCNTQPASNVYY